MRWAPAAATLLLALPAAAQDRTPGEPGSDALDEITIFGDPHDVTRTAGSAAVIDSEALEQFKYTDVQRMMRQVPGVSIQIEDGYGLRPNLSIRGTASERSSRITLLEDNVLVAPAPYSAPSAYYFPTAGRMSRVEVLKGSSSIKQGPYTVGGSMNFVSTLIPEQQTGTLNIEYGQNQTSRLHGVYGNSGDNFGWLVEGHLWNSDGFQNIDFTDDTTGLDKDDWMLKFRFNSDRGNSVYHQFDVKFQYARESSEQSYLGLVDSDFDAAPLRRYGASRFDNIETEHDQVIARYLVNFNEQFTFTATAYSNNHERDWFKTEGIDPDGSTSAEDFSRTSWFNAIQAVNRGESLGNLSAADLQSILDGGDTPIGSIQLRSNAREYFSRGIQLGLSWSAELGESEHKFEAGVRFHEDEEDRLQRNSSYHQENGDLVLDDLGLLGNAGNRVQEARAASLFVQDEIAIGNLVLTPGVRYEDIDQQRTRWETRTGLTTDPSSRDSSNLRDSRENRTRVWIPGMGALYAVNDKVAIYGGVHKGFTAPSNAPDVGEEESINYEFGLRYSTSATYLDTAVFFTDYDNILGECTSSSGSDCEVGDAFNGDAASVLGVEGLLSHSFTLGADLSLPLMFSYTWLDATFDSDIADTAFFGNVSKGDPLPYIPENQFLVSVGLEAQRWATYLSANYVDETCVAASCATFEVTDEFLILDLSAQFNVNEHMMLYARIDNLADEEAIVARHPYGARPALDRTASVGVRFSL
ncbi:MAG: TonB-dependent receptor [Gammaproteobacteria bacterium]|nr:TonB-dependent receptor [Gammaproteobacteria bacterium]